MVVLTRRSNRELAASRSHGDIGSDSLLAHQTSDQRATSPEPVHEAMADTAETSPISSLPTLNPETDSTTAATSEQQHETGSDLENNHGGCECDAGSHLLNLQHVEERDKLINEADTPEVKRLTESVQRILNGWITSTTPQNPD